MKKHYPMLILTILFVGFLSVDAKASFTVATFADPSNNSSNPLFTVDLTAQTLTGGWSDSKTGLTLQVPFNGHTYSNAWFNVSQLLLTPVLPGTLYSTSSGVINFYKDTTSTDPLLIINFSSGDVSVDNFGANNILVAANVTITGSEITGILSEEEFSFSFVNTAQLLTHSGFTSTASFTSSAVPEPATISLLCLGWLGLVNRKNVHNKK